MNASMVLERLDATQVWSYSFGGRTVEFAFVDAALDGRFRPASPGALRTIVEAVPSAPLGAAGWEIGRCFISGAGRRRRGGATREEIAVALPAPGDEDRWWEGTAIRIRVIDARGGSRTVADRPLSRADIHLPEEVGEMAIVAAEADLPPGRHAVRAEFRGRLNGSFLAPLEVRDFRGSPLMISDLCFGLPGSPAPAVGAGEEPAVPNPGGLVPRGGAMPASFEVYNLVRDPAGLARYQVRYTVLPRTRALAWVEAIASGAAPPDSGRRFGDMGADPGDAAPTRERYLDLLFPAVEVAVGAGSTGRFGFLLETGNLDPGVFALVVTVNDLVSGASATVEAPFRVVPSRGSARAGSSGSRIPRSP